MELRRSQVSLHWASGNLLYDPPEKLAAPFERASDRYLGAQLARIAAAVESELLVVSPYFVPGTGGVQFFGGKKASGVDVRILTNSLAATDAWLVHAAYKKYRRPLLRKSVRIYELKPEARADSGVKGSVGTSRSSLHGKTFVFDRTSVFIGSLNIDPRSLRQNTESGVLVGDKALAGDVAALFELWSSPDYAYELGLQRAPHRHRLTWMTNEGGNSVKYHSEPGAGILRRMGVNIAALFPIESQV
jgi:putative cardiolipin synthase